VPATADSIDAMADFAGSIFAIIFLINWVFVVKIDCRAGVRKDRKKKYLFKLEVLAFFYDGNFKGVVFFVYMLYLGYQHIGAGKQDAFFAIEFELEHEYFARFVFGVFAVVDSGVENHNFAVHYFGNFNFFACK
jgi:hypothetical protein